MTIKEAAARIEDAMVAINSKVNHSLLEKCAWPGGTGQWNSFVIWLDTGYKISVDMREVKASTPEALVNLITFRVRMALMDIKDACDAALERLEE